MPCESSLLAELDVIVNKSLKSIPVPSFAYNPKCTVYHDGIYSNHLTSRRERPLLAGKLVYRLCYNVQLLVHALAIFN